MCKPARTEYQITPRWRIYSNWTHVKPFCPVPQPTRLTLCIFDVRLVLQAVPLHTKAHLLSFFLSRLLPFSSSSPSLVCLAPGAFEMVMRRDSADVFIPLPFVRGARGSAALPIERADKGAICHLLPAHASRRRSFPCDPKRRLSKPGGNRVVRATPWMGGKCERAVRLISKSKTNA